MKNSFSLYLNGVLIALLIFTYYNTFVWMEDRWDKPNSYYSHGYLVPFVTAFLVWRERKCFQGITYSPSRVWIVLLSIGIFIQIASAFMRVHFTSAFSFVLVLLGIVYYLFGKDIGKKFLFPILFLTTMIPIPLSVVAGLTLELKLFAARCSIRIIDLLGIPAVQDGSRISFSNCTILVADVCSGLRSLIALISFGALFAYISTLSNYMKLNLFFLSVPAALIANIARIIIVSLIANKWGTEVAESLHSTTGILVFVIAFILLFSFGRGLYWIDRLFFFRTPTINNSER